MANIKISDLPAAANTTGADVLPIVQSNTTKKAALSLLPVSAATQTALDAKADAAATQTALDSKVDESLLGSPSGVATLDVAGKLTSSQIPDIAVSDYLGAAANEAAMLALTGQKGDWCSRTDLGTNWIITGSNPAQIGSWTQLSYPASPVVSVNGEVGAVVLDKSDIGLGNVDNTSDADKPVSTAMQTALNAKADQVPVSSSQIIPVNGSITIADARYARRQVSTTFNGPSAQTVTVNLPTPSLGDVMFLDVSLVQAATMNINGGGFSTSLSNVNPTWGIGSANFVLICTIPNTWTDSGFHRHTDANSVNAGFMSSSDKTKLDGIQSGATANTASTSLPQALGVASAGTSAAYSRGDHVHAIPYAEEIASNEGDVQSDLTTLYNTTAATNAKLTALNLPQTFECLEVYDYSGPAATNIDGLLFFQAKPTGYGNTLIWRSEYTTKSPSGYFYISVSDQGQSLNISTRYQAQTYTSGEAFWYPNGGAVGNTDALSLESFSPYVSTSNAFGSFSLQITSADRFPSHADRHSFWGVDAITPQSIAAAEETVETLDITSTFPTNWTLPATRNLRATYTFVVNRAFAWTFPMDSARFGDTALITVKGGSTGGVVNGITIPANTERSFRYFYGTAGWTNAPVLDSALVAFGSGGTGHNPASVTAYFIGDLRDLNPTVSASQRILRFPTGTIIGYSLVIYVGGTLGVITSPTQPSLDLVTSANVVAGNLSSIGINYAASQQSFIGDCNISVVAGTAYALRITTPTFTTAPTSVRYSGWLRFRRENG